MNIQPDPLYSGANSLVYTNYPPLSFYLVGAFGRFVIGDMIVAERIVSLLASAGLLGLCIRCPGGCERGGLARSVLLLLVARTFLREHVAVNDPHWLAHTLMLGGHETASLPARVMVMAALLVLAGGFVSIAW